MLESADIVRLNIQHYQRLLTDYGQTAELRRRAADRLLEAQQQLRDLGAAAAPLTPPATP